MTNDDIAVTDLMTTNAGDEFHQPGNWQTCINCRRAYPLDLDECPWGCETPARVEQ